MKKNDADVWVQMEGKQLLELCTENYHESHQLGMKYLVEAYQKRKVYQILPQTMESQKMRCDSLLEKADWADAAERILDAYFEGQPPRKIVNGALIFKEAEANRLRKSVFGKQSKNVKTEFLKKLLLMQAHRRYCRELSTRTSGLDIEFDMFEPVLFSKKQENTRHPFQTDLFFFMRPILLDGLNPKVSLNGKLLEAKDDMWPFELCFDRLGVKRIPFRMEVEFPKGKWNVKEDEIYVNIQRK